MNSYQKRKQDILYLEQCIKELESLCLYLVKNSKTPLPLSAGKGITSDQFITPYNQGTYITELLIAREGK